MYVCVNNDPNTSVRANSASCYTCSVGGDVQEDGEVVGALQLLGGGDVAAFSAKDKLVFEVFGRAVEVAIDGPGGAGAFAAGAALSPIPPPAEQQQDFDGSSLDELIQTRAVRHSHAIKSYLTSGMLLMHVVSIHNTGEALPG
jgi:hypothetical protein